MLSRDWPVLFHDHNLRAVLEAHLNSVEDAVRELGNADFDAQTDEYLAALIASKLVVAPVELLEGKVSVTPRETKIDVSHDPNRYFSRPGPHYVDGIEITYHIPFVGEADLFKCAPNQFTTIWPRGFVERNELRFPYDAPNRDLVGTKARFEKDVAEIKRWLGWVNNQVDEYNLALEPRVRQAVARRRAEINKTQADIAALGYAVRSERGASKRADSSPGELAAQRAQRRQATRRQYDVALSFAGENREYVEEVARHLKSLGVEVFYDRYQEVNLWGRDLTEHLGHVYSRDSHFVVMFASRH